jgi:hypothetical protein
MISEWTAHARHNVFVFPVSSIGLSCGENIAIKRAACTVLEEAHIQKVYSSPIVPGTILGSLDRSLLTPCLSARQKLPSQWLREPGRRSSEMTQWPKSSVHSLLTVNVAALASNSRRRARMISSIGGPTGRGA